MDLSETFTKPLKDFAKNSIRLVKRCSKPDIKGKQKVHRSVCVCVCGEREKEREREKKKKLCLFHAALLDLLEAKEEACVRVRVLPE